MLKGLRWPLVVMASLLLIVALLPHPGDGNATTAAAESETETPIQTAAETARPLPAAPAIAPQNVLVEALVGEIRKINPLLATNNAVDRDIASLIFEGLTTINQYGEVIPDLATAWTVSPDGLQYVFELRQDVLWHDGVPFTSADVVFTVEVLSDPQFPGAETLYSFWRTVEVDALGDYLVRFRLTHPLASFPDYLRIGIIPAHVLRGVPANQLGSHPFNLASPIGTGPYQIETLTANEGQIDGIQLRVAPNYRLREDGADGYALDRVVFRTYASIELALDAYQRGEVNSIGDLPLLYQTAAQQLNGLSIYTAPRANVGMLIYNWDRLDFASNPRVRLALAHALNRSDLVTDYMASTALPADSPLPPTNWAYVAGLEWPDYSLDQARAMLSMSNADSVTGGDQPRLEASLTVLTLNDPALVGLANEIGAEWGTLGLSARVEAVDAVALRERLAGGDFDVAVVEYSFEPGADPDPFVFWHQSQDQNYGRVNDRRISEALEMARRDPEGINRAVYYQRFQELFAERVPALPLYVPLYQYVADQRLQGVQLGFLSTPSDRFLNIKDWRFAGP